MQIAQTIIKFPEITLKTRDAHKLRGYFGNVFKEHSPLLHNHFEDGKNRYAYPLVQYKVISNIPMLVGFNQGSELLTSLFLQLKEIKIEDQQITVRSKNIEQIILNLNTEHKLYNYSFATLWMGLNQKNHKQYSEIKFYDQKQDFLDNAIRNSILSFYKGIGFWTKEQILVTSKLKEKQTMFKNKKMLAFEGSFVSNAFIPNYAGIGKSTSRGFGTVILNK